MRVNSDRRLPFFDVFLSVGPIVAFLIIAAALFVPRGSLIVSIALFMPIHILSEGHVAIGVLRSHLNPSIFEPHRRRLILVPVLSFIALFSSDIVFTLGSILFLFWVNHHYLMQHFGVLRRIGGLQSSSSSIERRIEIIVCGLCQWVPLLAFSRAAIIQDMKPHVANLGFDGSVLKAFDPLSILVTLIAQDFMLFTYLFVAGYAVYITVKYSAWRNLRPALRVIFVVSLLAISHLPLVFGVTQALLTAAFLHSLQYYFIVAASEQNEVQDRSWSKVLGLNSVKIVLIFGCIAGLCSTANRMEQGFGVDLVSDATIKNFAIFMIWLNLIHFWSDGFIWKRQKRSAEIKSGGNAELDIKLAV